ncbi:FGGY-family pentulose kinase [Faunimonas pinastri]|uniref:FGGY-family pentulose kinase n=1 Tax=Faunimonas pinastri TaxID=1855383 RepID=A0A1H9C4E5_9HYPH|nr:FGGY-family carbohydrate kinase [Faunimonas pinastri]SEP95851.1 FGGY-family pentulose kinase [Faunimonas pinastri]
MPDTNTDRQTRPLPRGVTAAKGVREFYVGVDVGTGSARAGLFDGSGQMVSAARQPIETWHDPGDIAEQSSEDIWAACVRAVREAMAEAGISRGDVRGIGFDATCSLVVLDGEARPLSVSRSGDPRRNIVVWMDHRALEQADRINATGHEVLRYVGGIISPEMETPKILWLKENLPDTYQRAEHFLDLADFLTFRATGSTARSLCTTACKWTYLAHESRWSADYFDEIGLSELKQDDFRRIGQEIVEPGAALGRGLTEEAAAQLGLAEGTPVAAGLIDAHAGGVGTLGGSDPSGSVADARRRIGYIMGTSACIMATTDDPAFVPGVWGPYFSAMFPGFWLNEGGQSASGAALDHLIRSHPAHADANAAAQAGGISLLEFLEGRIASRVPGMAEAARLARDIHVLPEYLGNRSPHADPHARAVIAGLAIEDDLESLESLFVAGICGLAYGLADVIDALKAKGIPCELLVISGGASRSALTRQILADATGVPVALAATPEPVLLGAAMLGAVAAGAHPTLGDAAAAMSRLGQTTAATSPDLASFHAAKRKVHRAMQAFERNSREIMAGLSASPH